MYSTGYNGKLSFNAATSYKDKLYICINLNSHFTDFRKSSVFYEDNSNPLNSQYQVTKLQFNNDLYTYGTGFSFQMGASSSDFVVAAIHLETQLRGHYS